MPARNVGSMIGNVLESLSSASWDMIDQLVIIDNGSEDDTIAQIRHFVESDRENGQRVALLENGRNIGYGGSIKRGLQYFAAASCDVVIIVHSDDQCDHNAVIGDLVTAVRQKEDLEVVLGVRTAKSEPEGPTFDSYRSLGNAAVTLAGRLLTGSRARDVNTPITLIRRSAIARVPVDHLTSGILLHPQLNTLLTTEGRFAFAEVDVRWWDASHTERRPLNRMGLAILRGFFTWCVFRRVLRRDADEVLDRINRVEVREDYSSLERAGGSN
jgi:glycosyltransferase involved in cell wall biosynthesis